VFLLGKIISIFTYTQPVPVVNDEGVVGSIVRLLLADPRDSDDGTVIVTPGDDKAPLTP
jgi:hypothetical protein